jgi:hypothetical protein
MDRPVHQITHDRMTIVLHTRNADHAV